MKKTLLLLCVVLLFAAGCDDKATTTDSLAIAKTIFFEDVSYDSLNKKDPEFVSQFVHTLADDYAEDNWRYKSERISFSESGYNALPLTVAHTILIQGDIEDNVVFYQQLLIYNEDGEEWRPLSSNTMFLGNDEMIESSYEDIWTPENDWCDIY